MEKEIVCDCGWSFRGGEDELIAAVLAHAREVHRLELTRDQALAAAKPVAPEQPPRDARAGGRER